MNHNMSTQPCWRNLTGYAQETPGPTDSPYLCDSAHGLRHDQEEREHHTLISFQNDMSPARAVESPLYTQAQAASARPHKNTPNLLNNLDTSDSAFLETDANTKPILAQTSDTMATMATTCMEDIDLTSSFSDFAFAELTKSYHIVSKSHDMNPQRPFNHLDIPSYQTQALQPQITQSGLPEMMNGTTVSTVMASCTTPKALCNSLVEIGIQTIVTTTKMSIRTALDALSYFIGDF